MTTQEIRTLKKEIRLECKSRRNLISPQEKLELDAKICKNIISSQSFKFCDVVLMFYPTQNEIDLLEVFHKAKELGKGVAFPKCISRGIMKFFFVETLLDLQKGKYNIYEPCNFSEDNCFTGSCHPLCLVPSLTATVRGQRLGYGGGYYDRFLSHFEGISACVQYQKLLYDTLPQEKRYDKKFDLLVTDAGVKVIG